MNSGWHPIPPNLNRRMVICGIDRSLFIVGAVLSVNFGFLVFVSLGFGFWSLAGSVLFFLSWLLFGAWASADDSLFLAVLWSSAWRAQYYDPLIFRPSGVTWKWRNARRSV